MYHHYIAELSRIGRREFKLTPAEARKIAHEVLVVSVLSVNRIYCEPMEAVDLYTRQCSLNVSAKDLAVMGATLADGGVNPLTRRRVVESAEWSRFFDEVSLRHLGHPATLTVIEPGAADTEARTLPLLGITVERTAGSDIAVMLGSPDAPHLTHVIRRPVEVRVEERHTHGVTRLQMLSDEGTETLLELTRPQGA